MWAVIYGIITTIFPALGKWLPNPDRELGRAETDLKTDKQLLKDTADEKKIQDTVSRERDGDALNWLRNHNAD